MGDELRLRRLVFGLRELGLSSGQAAQRLGMSEELATALYEGGKDRISSFYVITHDGRKYRTVRANRRTIGFYIGW